MRSCPLARSPPALRQQNAETIPGQLRQPAALLSSVPYSMIALQPSTDAPRPSRSEPQNRPMCSGAVIAGDAESPTAVFRDVIPRIPSSKRTLDHPARDFLLLIDQRGGVLVQQIIVQRREKLVAAAISSASVG